MVRRLITATCLIVVACLAAPAFHAESAAEYRFSFPERQHHWMQVEASFTGLASKPVELRMSRSSPGRYSLHDFAKNVYDLHALGPDNRELAITRSDANGWTVPQHGASLTLHNKVFGDVVDGTYLAVDRTHAHMNMPAVIIWVREFDDRPVTIRLAEPSGTRWQVATQLHQVLDPSTQLGASLETARAFTAPNLQYLMDSPIEFGPLSVRHFAVGGRTFNFAVHHTGTEAELDAFSKNVEKIVREEGAVFAEFPLYEPNSYTFIADYLPYATEDGMEHRNSTVMTSRSSIQTSQFSLLDTVAHEFFHSWNVERIRPRSLEPFDLERTNMSGELWFAEGFTQYYGPVALSRVGLVDWTTTVHTLAGLITAVVLDPAYRLRSAVQMSEMGVFTDGARPIDRTNWSDTYISYYQFGGAIALALDLTLRERSDGRTTLDDYMRGMWRVHGKPGGGREGYVDRPYTMTDAEARLADVTGDAAFAREFFAKYISGHETADYARLLIPAGLVLRKQYPGRASLGMVRLNDERGGGAHLADIPPSDSPAYAAGLDEDDEIRQLDGSRIASRGDVNSVLQRHRPGDKISIVFADASGSSQTATITLIEDPRLELVPVESAGGSLTPAQKTFRTRWLGARAN